MNVLIGKYSGLCAGAKNTLSKAEQALIQNKSGIDCLGEILHNKQVIADLEKKGLRIIDNIEDARDKVIIRAHGINKDVYYYAKKHDIELIDLTCPNVLKIHDQVQKYSDEGYFIFLLGINNHPETIGTYSFCGKNSYLIENLDDVFPAVDALKSSNLNDVFIISQTTFSLELFEEIKEKILEILEPDFNIKIEKSICNATVLRQQEADEISSKVDLMIIIGGKNSANTLKLYDISKKNLENVIHIQTKDDLDLNFIKKFKNIGIMAGASTPSSTIDDIVNICKEL